MPHDAATVERVLKFMGALTHTKGKWGGKPFQLIPWERQATSEIFGTVAPDGKRQYRTCYIEIPKKSGKSEWTAGVGLYGLVGDGEFAPEVYIAAGDRDQAGIVFKAATTMVRQSPYLSKRLRIIDSQRRIIDPRTDGVLRVLSSESHSKHGYSPSMVIFDELHAQPKRDLWDVLTESTDAAREQQLIIAITTAGVHDPKAICWEVRERARKARDGLTDDPTMYCMIYGLEPDEDYHDEANWAKANPALGHVFDMDYIRKAYQEALSSPVKMLNFRRFRLNQWVGSHTTYIPMERWDAAKRRIDWSALDGRTCFVGMDLSSTTDLTAVGLFFPSQIEGQPHILLSRGYIPEGAIQERVKRDRVPYDVWAEQGHIVATPGDVVNHAYIKRDIVNFARRYNVQEVAYDPWGAIKLANELEAENITVVEHRQGYKSMSPPTKELRKMVMAGGLTHDGSPALRWCVDNMCVKSDEAENEKPDKRMARERIDMAVACIMAVGAWIAAKESGSVYDTRGPIFLGGTAGAGA